MPSVEAPIYLLDLPPEHRKIADEIRKTYAKDFKKYCFERLFVMDRDDPSGPQRKPFSWNKMQEGLWAFREQIKALNRRIYRLMGVPESDYPIRGVVLKARKGGASTFIEALENWRCEHESGCEALTMAHEADAANTISGINRRFVSWFPNHDRIKIGMKRESGKIVEWDSRWGSTIQVKTAGSKSGAAAGSTFNFIHISEEAKFGENSQEAAIALNAATKYAEIWEESTAQGPSGLFFDSWENALYPEELSEILDEAERTGQPAVVPETWNRAFRFFWAWWQDEGYQQALMPGEADRITTTMTEAERQGIADYGWTFEQIKWRRDKIANECAKQSEMEPELYFRQEYPSNPTEAFITKGKGVFSRIVLGEYERASRELRPGLYRVTRTGDAQFEKVRVYSEQQATLFVQEEPVEGRQYIAGADAGEGLQKGDDSVFSLFDRMDGMSIAEACRYIGKAPPAELGDLGVWLGKQYNNAFVVPERAGTAGGVTCYRFQELKYPWVYHRDVPDKISDIEGSSQDFFIGFSMNKSTKGLLVFDIGLPNLRDRLIVIRHRKAIKQWTIFENNDGDLGAPPGQNDDCVIADLLAAFGAFTPGIAPFIHQAENELILAELSKLSPEARAVAESFQRIKQKREEYWKINEAKERAAARRSRRGSRGFY